MRKLLQIITWLAIILVISGCSGGRKGNINNDTNNIEEKSKLNSGKVSDAYISGAYILIDKNTSTKGQWDKGDINKTTDSNGSFKVTVDDKVKIGTFIYSRGGTNIATGEEFKGTLKAIYEGGDKITVTPLTSMVASQIEDKENITKEDIKQAKQNVAKALNIDEEQVNADPVLDKDAFKATQKIVAIAKVLGVKDSDLNITSIIDKIAKNLSNDNNLTKAVKEASEDDNLTNKAITVANFVEKNIEYMVKNKSGDDNVTNITIEKIVNNNIKKVVKDIKEDKNITKSFEEINTNLVADCLTFNKIKGSNSSSSNVISDLNVSGKSLCEKDNVIITWINHGGNVDLNGTITRENYTMVNSFLEANITKGDNYLIKKIHFTISQKGHKPNLTQDITTINSDQNVTINVLSNDIDIDGDNLIIKSITQPKHGKAIISDNNKSINYSPNENYVGSDSLLYTVKDPLGAEVNGTVNIVVNISKSKRALNQISNFDPKEGDLNQLIENIENITKDSNESDAQTIYALTELVKSLNNNLGNIFVIDGDGGNIIGQLLKGNKNISINDALDTIDSLSDVSSESLSDLVSKINEASAKIEAMYSNDENYTFNYKGFELNKNDGMGLVALLKLESFNLEYIAAYNIIKPDYIKTKTKTINGIEYEYQAIKINPVVVLNNSTTLSLRGDAQSHFDNSKANLLASINAIKEFNQANSNLPEGIVLKLVEFKNRATNMENSLKGNGTYDIHSASADRTIFINLAALFNVQSAPTLSTIIGNNFEYVGECDGNVTYNEDKSIVNNIAIVDGCMEGYMPANIRPNSIPDVNNSHLDDIVDSIQISENIYRGEDVINILLNNN